MMSYSLTLLGSFLNSVIGRGSIRACTYALIQTGEIFKGCMIDGLGEM